MKKTSIALLLLATGCGMQVQNYTRSIDRGAPAVTEGNASLIVVRRGGIGEMVTLMDDQGRVIAQVDRDTWVRIPLAPGRHRIYSIPGKVTDFASVVDVDAQAGRLYYASVPRVGGLWAVAPRHEDRWKHRQEWIAAAHEVELDESKRTLLETELDEAVRKEAIDKVEKAWAKMDPKKQADFTLAADDGVTE